MSSQPPTPEWFTSPELTGEDPPGLRFSCTLCGNCCSGPEGYVLVSDAEAAALATRLNITTTEFLKTYTHQTSAGRSLTERLGPHGHDCVFLDRQKIPGKAVCGVYEDRPAQCRTWPFWKSVVASPKTWRRAQQVCPGMGKGNFVPADQIRIQRDIIDI